MTKYICLLSIEDNSVDIMLEIPSIHPSISNVEVYVDVMPKVTNDIQQSQHIDLDPTELLSHENDATLYQSHDHLPLHFIRGKSNKCKKQFFDHKIMQRHVPRIGSDLITKVSFFY